MKVKHLKISHTSLAAWRKSPRRFLYEYLLGLRPRKADFIGDSKFGSPLDFGIAVHKFEETRPREASKANKHATQLANETTLPSTGNRSKEHLIKLCEAYANHYPYQPARHEVELSFPLNDRVTYVAHIDVITDVNTLIDLKTTSKHLAYDWLPTIAPNPQAIGYIVAAQANGIPAESLTFRGISTDHKLLDPTYVPRKRDGSSGERPPLFLDVEFIPQPHEIAEWRETIERDAARLIQDIEQGIFTCHCNIGDFCNYRICCLTAPADRDIVISNMFESEAFRGFEITYEEDQCSKP